MCTPKTLLKHGIKIPEANIQAEFYHHARLLKFNTVLELTTPAGRLDISVLSADASFLLAVVECKSNKEKKVRRNRQIDRYKKLGVPVFGLADFDRAEHLAQQIKRDYVDNPEHTGVPLATVMTMEKIKKRKPRPPRHIYWDSDLNIKDE